MTQWQPIRKKELNVDDKKREEAEEGVTIGFALRFLFRYLRTRTMAANDANRIARAADDGRRLAQALDWLMLQLSVSYFTIRPSWNLQEIEEAAGRAAAGLRLFGVSAQAAATNLAAASLIAWTEDGMGEEE